MKYTLEICAGSLRSALAAQEGNADRVELCDNLSEGGTTPSYGMIKVARSVLNIPVFPIIRPRGGNFVYSDEEFEIMKQDVRCCLELGCEGVVFGILLPDGAVDIKRCSELTSLAGGMQLTFHRAFDRCRYLEKSLEEIIGVGFHRVLTSGGMEHAEQAIPQLKKLVVQAKNRISIMPGSGLTCHNLSRIASNTGAFEFHTTAKSPIGQKKHGAGWKGMEASPLFETDLSQVIELRRILDSGIIDIKS